MRIATNQYQSIMLQSLGLNQDLASHTMEQMASGNRIGLPSDDPVDSVRLSRLQREEASIKQYRANIDAIKLRLSKTEGYLTNMVNEMIPGRDLLVWASDGGNAPADLNAMVPSLVALRDSLLANANTIDQEGNYVFSGTATTTPPISFNPGAAVGSRYAYAGNLNPQNVVVGNGITEVANTNVAGLENLLNSLDTAIATMQTPGVNVNNPAVRADLKAALDGFDSAIDLLSDHIAKMGGTQNTIQTLDDNHANVSLSNQTAIHDIGALDYAQAASDLSGYQAALEATYKAYGKIGNLTLFSEL